MTHSKKTTRWHANTSKESDAVSEVKNRHCKSVANLKSASVNKSVIYNIMRKDKAFIYNLSRSKVPITQQTFHYRHAIKPANLFCCATRGVHFSSCNNLANLDYFAKVSISVGSLIPMLLPCIINM